MKALLLLLSLAFGASAAIIPDARRITWEGNVGIPGGIPARTTIYATLPDGTSLATIQSTLVACPADQTVKLGPGMFHNTGTIWIPPSVTLRGSGMGITIISNTGANAGWSAPYGEASGAIQFQTGGSEFTGTARTIVSGYTKDSTNITLSSGSGIVPGVLMAIDQLNDATLPVSLVGTGGSLNYGTRSSAARAFGQTVLVAAVSGADITFWPPLYHTYSGALSPEAVYYFTPCYYAGVEDLTLYATATGAGYSAMIYMNGVQNCWVKGVENDYADKDHVDILSSYRCEVRDSYFHDGFVHSGGGTDNQILLASKTSACLIENNILIRMHAGVMLNWGASGNVVAYNYAAHFFDQNSQNVMMYSFNGNHGAHPSYNLFEGNAGGQHRDDSYWGSSSHGTLLRNYYSGDEVIFPPYTGRSAWDTNNSHHASQGLRGIVLDFAQSYYNLIGNVVGSTYGSDHDVFQVVAPTARSYETTLYLFSLGYSDVSDSGGDGNDSTLPYTTGIFHGNYDYVNAAQMWDGSIADHVIPPSYYLPSKPAWFSNVVYPPIGGDLSPIVSYIPAQLRFYGMNYGAPNQRSARGGFVTSGGRISR